MSPLPGPSRPLSRTTAFLLVALLGPPARAAQIFTDGFESGDLTEWSSPRLEINEVNPNLAGSMDLLELRAVTAGNASGIAVWMGQSTPVLLATLPSVSLAVGDVVVIHLVPPAGVTTETSSTGECLDSACYPSAWDVRGGVFDLVFSDRMLAVVSPAGALRDGVPFDNSDGSTVVAYRSDLQLLQALDLWQPPNCGGELCTDITTPTAEAVSVSWSGVGSSTTGPSAQRTTAADHDSNADWTVAASTWGLPNLGQ